MFGLDRKSENSERLGKKSDLNSSSINLIGAGTVIEGRIITKNDIRIDGSVNGNIRSEGKVVLGQKANIDGNMYCADSDLSGRVEGNVICKGFLQLKATARIQGDIFTKHLEIENGAQFNGYCNTGEKKAIEKWNSFDSDTKGRKESKEANGSDVENDQVKAANDKRSGLIKEEQKKREAQKASLK